MKRQDFMNKVVEIYFRDNCTTSQAIDKARKELNISNTQYIDWFGKGKKEGVENEVCPSLHE